MRPFEPLDVGVSNATRHGRPGRRSITSDLLQTGTDCEISAESRPNPLRCRVSRSSARMRLRPPDSSASRRGYVRWLVEGLRAALNGEDSTICDQVVRGAGSSVKTVRAAGWRNGWRARPRCSAGQSSSSARRRPGVRRVPGPGVNPADSVLAWLPRARRWRTGGSSRAGGVGDMVRLARPPGGDGLEPGVQPGQPPCLSRVRLERPVPSISLRTCKSSHGPAISSPTRESRCPGPSSLSRRISPS